MNTFTQSLQLALELIVRGDTELMRIVVLSLQVSGTACVLGTLMGLTLGAALAAVVGGASVVRAHDVAATVDALAVFTARRISFAPDIPTMQEAGVDGYDLSIWFGFMAPAGTPQPIIDTLNKAILEVLALPETKKQLLDLGIEAKGSTPAELGEKLKQDIVKWTAIIDKSGIEKQ